MPLSKEDQLQPPAVSLKQVDICPPPGSILVSNSDLVLPLPKGLLCAPVFQRSGESQRPMA